MIQPLRVVHRRAFLVLALALPSLLLVGLVARRETLPNSTGLPTSFRFVKSAEHLGSDQSLPAALYTDAGDPSHIYVFVTQSPKPEPDLLLYWSNQDVSGGFLPPGSRLLGAVVPGRPFPLDSNLKSGYLVLYSLAHQRVVDLEKMP